MIRHGEKVHSTAIRALLFIVEYHAAHGRGPTYPVLMEHLGIARTTLHHHLKTLRRKGLVTWELGRNGTLRPLVARVALGQLVPKHQRSGLLNQSSNTTGS